MILALTHEEGSQVAEGSQDMEISSRPMYIIILVQCQSGRSSSSDPCLSSVRPLIGVLSLRPDSVIGSLWSRRERLMTGHRIRL
jgi:hypothetical protein